MSGPLKNARHEKFAQGLAEGKTEDQAYRDAGFKPNRHNASRLLNTKENVRDRVKELQGVGAQEISDLAAYTRGYTREAVDLWVTILKDPKASDSARMRASENLIERGWGKALQRLTAMVKRPEDMSLAELRAFIGDEEAERIAQEMAASETPTRH